MSSVAAGAPPEQERRRGLLDGRLIVLLGIVLLAISLRYTVTGLSPLLGTVTDAMGIGTSGATFIGMLPTISFGIGGFLAPVIARRTGPELAALLAVSLAAIGALLRPFLDSAPIFMALSFLALVGMGFGNVLGAPLVKKYFPDRQAGVITLFSLLMQAGATLPALTAIPVAEAANWRISLASWGVLSLVAALPWAIVWLRSSRGGARGAASSAGAGGPSIGLAQLITTPISLGTGLFYAMASLNIYAMLAWLPTILSDQMGLSTAEAAGVFSIYTFMTLPMAVITPVLANRLRNPVPLGVLLAAAGPAGYLLMILGVGPLWFATLVAGLAGGAFPYAIAMFNLRTRTTAGSSAIAGFAMGVGYLIGTFGPLLGGWLLAATGGWIAPLWLYTATFIPMALGAVLMARPGRSLEDHLPGRQTAAAEATGASGS